MILVRRSSNSPRYFVPATSAPMSRANTRRSFNVSGTAPSMIVVASFSTIAVLPTPGSPTSTGLFLVRRESIWMTRSSSLSRPMTGSNLPSRAIAVRSIAMLSRTGVREREDRERRLGLEATPSPDVSRCVASFTRLSVIELRRSRSTTSPSPSLSNPISRCSVPTRFCFANRASFTAVRMTFFARGSSVGAELFSSTSRLTMNSSFERISPMSASRFANTCAATPSFSRSNAKSRCSIVMKGWLKRFASSCATSNTRRERSENMSNPFWPWSAIALFSPNGFHSS